MATRWEQVLAWESPAPVQRAALGVVIEALPAERWESVAETWTRRVPGARADEALLEEAAPAFLALDGVARGVTSGWSLLPAVAGWRELRAASRLGGVLPLSGAWGPVADDLRRCPGAAAGVLPPQWLQDLCRGGQREQAPGWPAWVAEEAAVAHVHRRAAPTHFAPASLGAGLPAARPYAMIGACLAAWLGEEVVRRVALTSASPEDGWGERVGRALALADLQRWCAAGGAWVGPTWSDPFAWCRLLSAVVHGGPLDGLIGRDGPVSVERALSTPDLLSAASALRWDQLGAWGAATPDAAVEDGLRLAVEAMFVEDVQLGGLHVAPSDPPGGRVVLEVEACTLSCGPRGHHQYTEPARHLVPPSWCASLARRGVLRVEIEGCVWEHRDDVLDVLREATSASGSVRTRVGPPPRSVWRAPADRQVRPPDGLLPVGARVAHALAAALPGFAPAPSPLGCVEDPLSAARGLGWAATQEPLPRDVVVPAADGRWGGRGFDPSLVWRDRPSARAALEARLEAARAALRRRPLVLLGWGTAWAGDRLLEVDEVVAATEAALDEVGAWHGAPRVVLLVDPGREAGRSVEDDAAGKAVLTLAARRVAARPGVAVLPALERVRDDGGNVGLDAAGALGGEGFAAVLDLFERCWLAPDARALAAAIRRGEGADGHALLAVRAEVLPEPTPEFDVAEGEWPAPLESALRRGEWLAADVAAAWAEAVHAALDVRPAGREAEILQALLDKVEELEDPDVVAPIVARVVEEWLPSGAWDDDEVARWLAVVLQRRWAEVEVSAIPADRRAGLARALAAHGRAARPGMPARTPLERLRQGLVASDE